ncbi:MAG: hypothetical protein PVJ64_04120 [Gemmatimonadales bacterium]|jgi:hypothetical protein
MNAYGIARRALRSATAALILTLVQAGTLNGDPASDRQILADRLLFFYIADPNASPAEQGEALDNAAILAGTEQGAFWNDAATAPLQGLVRRLLRDARNGGDEVMQYYASRIVALSEGDRKVVIFMFNDLNQALTATARNNWGGCLDGNGKAWPCAAWRDADGVDGVMWLGAFHMRTARARSTFLHELVHTRDRTDGRAHYFTTGGVNYRYGQDQVHYGVEILPNQAMTYKEGIANAVRLLYHYRSEVQYFDLFAQNDFLWVEKAAPQAAAGVSPDVWLYNQLQAAGVAEDPVPEDLRQRLRPELVNNYAAYRFRTLPARFMMHNEYVLALILAKYAEYVSPGRLFFAIGAVSDELYLASGSGLALLFEILGELGLPEEMSLDGLQQSYEGPKRHLLPLAFVDYFTAYKTPANDRRAFAALFEDMLPQPWVDAYVTGYQAAVRAAAPAAGGTGRPTPGDLTDIALALGIQTSEPD